MKNHKVTPIPFSEVRNWIKDHENVPHSSWGTINWHPEIWDLIDNCVLFSEYYCKFPFGFAETDDMFDPMEALTAIKNLNLTLEICKASKDKKELKQVVNQERKKQLERFAQGKNSTQLGRHIGRLHYLLSLEQEQLKTVKSFQLHLKSINPN